MEKHSPAENTTAQWLEAHAPQAVEIDVPALQSAPLTDLQTFEDHLKQYEAKDYLGLTPFYQLIWHSQFAGGQYDQFAHALRRAAEACGVSADVIEPSIQAFRQMFNCNTSGLDDVCDAIRSAAEDPEHAAKASVLCLPCGTGKSTALTKMIQDVIQRYDGNGLIIVTDSVERMRKYWEHDSRNPHFDDVLLAFIRSHQRDVVVLTSENIRTAMAQHYAPVVIMSTQGYFSWRKEDIQRLLRWEKGTRPLIIFDEMPYLSQIHEITPETLDWISTRLRMGIEPSGAADREWKRRMVAYWESVRTKLLSRLDQLEDAEADMSYCQAELDEGWQEFVSYIMDHAGKLNTPSDSVVTRVEDVQTLLTAWGVYSHRGTERTGMYENKFSVYRDHRDLVTELGAKVVILDGTADISPMYREDYIHLLPNRKFLRSLSYLTIRLCDVDTAERALRENQNSVLKMIHNYLKSVTGNDPNLVVFTRKSAEAAFHNLGMDAAHTGHFNNIKGLNSYNQATSIAQVGLNRMPPVNYFVMDLARDEHAREILSAARTPQEMADAIKQVREEMNYNVETMTSVVLADIEQNIFRSAIRNADNCQPVTYYLFFAHEQYERLVAAIRERYERLGATVEVVGGKAVEAFWPQDDVGARLERIQHWYDNWDGKAIKRKEILAVTSMTAKSFENTLKLRPGSHIALLMKAAQEKARAAGYKRGWFKKPNTYNIGDFRLFQNCSPLFLKRIISCMDSLVNRSLITVCGHSSP